ncbi:MAG TPA: DUF6265 family protein [Saprospiraceae bacterium]|nr:DUF6265 family protein [Saprospiraceae bacterium]HPN67940.1 DUF6265 family protein [Saprospiraceae bacterium]
MQSKLKYLCLFFCFLILCAWTIKESYEIKKVEWLIGTWENKTSRGSMYESWNKLNDSVLSGKSYIINEKDTIVFETIQIVQEENKLFYIPTVKNQNGNLPIRFAGKNITENQLIFENPDHDFPQIISYTKIGLDSLIAVISGVKNGQERKQTFAMKRVK